MARDTEKGSTAMALIDDAVYTVQTLSWQMAIVLCCWMSFCLQSDLIVRCWMRRDAVELKTRAISSGRQFLLRISLVQSVGLEDLLHCSNSPFYH